MASTRFWSPSETSPSMSSWRLRLLVFLVRMWRAWLWPRLILPVAVVRKRLAAPLCVFSFGMIASPSAIFPPRLDLRDVLQVLFEPLQKLRAEFAVRNLAPAKEDGGLHLVALLEPLAGVL